MTTRPLDRLMYGEDTGSRSADDIAHWIGAYTELLVFKERLLSDMESGMKSLSKPARSEIEELDVTLIMKQRERYGRRLEFWLARRMETQPKGDGVLRGAGDREV